MLLATTTWLRSPPTPTSTVWLISSLALPSSKPRLTMELASGTAPTPSTFPMAGSSTSATTPMMPVVTLRRSPTTALQPTLMLPSELDMVLSAMPSPTLLPSLGLLLLHLTALSAMVLVSVMAVPSLDKNPQQYLCIYQQ